MIRLDWDPTVRTLRQFAAIACAVLAGIAVVSWLRGGGWISQAVPLGLAGVVALLGGLRPVSLRLPFVLLSIAVFPIGFVVSHFVLLVVFYGVITPLGMLGRLATPDPLALRRDGASPSYWRERRRPRDKASYLRQA